MTVKEVRSLIWVLVVHESLLCFLDVAAEGADELTFALVQPTFGGEFDEAGSGKVRLDPTIQRELTKGQVERWVLLTQEGKTVGRIRVMLDAQFHGYLCRIRARGRGLGSTLGRGSLALKSWEDRCTAHAGDHWQRLGYKSAICWLRAHPE